MKHLGIILCLIFIYSCGTEEIPEYPENVTGMVPTYLDPDDSSLIRSTEPRAYENLGGIVERGSFIYVAELATGIHVVNNENPSNPYQIAFWEIPGCSAFTLSDNKLFVSNTVHLWVIDITDVYNIVVIDKEEDIFKDENNNLINRPPLDYNGFFECVDPDKGIPVRWRLETIPTPECRTI